MLDAGNHNCDAFFQSSARIEAVGMSMDGYCHWTGISDGSCVRFAVNSLKSGVAMLTSSFSRIAAGGTKDVEQ